MCRSFEFCQLNLVGCRFLLQVVAPGRYSRSPLQVVAPDTALFNALFAALLAVLSYSLASALPDLSDIFIVDLSSHSHTSNLWFIPRPLSCVILDISSHTLVGSAL